MPLWAWIYVTAGVVSVLWTIALGLDAFRGKPWWENALTVVLVAVFWWVALGILLYEEIDPDPDPWH